MYLRSFVSEVLISRSKSVPSPSLERAMMSRFTSNTESDVPSKAIEDGCFCDLNLKKMEEDMIASSNDPCYQIHQ